MTANLDTNNVKTVGSVTDNEKMSSVPTVSLITDNEKTSPVPKTSPVSDNEKRSSDPKLSLAFHLEEEAVEKEDFDKILEELCPDSYEEQMDIAHAWLEVCLTQPETMLYYQALTATERHKWLVEFAMWKLENAPPPSHGTSSISSESTPRPTGDSNKHKSQTKAVCTNAFRDTL